MKVSTTSNLEDRRSPESESPTHDQVAALAHQLYMESGCREGHAWEDWFRAEETLKSQRAIRSAAMPLAAVPSPVSARAIEVQPLDEREYPLARGKRGSASREEIRQQSIPRSARQSLRSTERSRQAR